jgi:hypothetical protein
MAPYFGAPYFEPMFPLVEARYLRAVEIECVADLTQALRTPARLILQMLVGLVIASTEPVLWFVEHSPDAKIGPRLMQIHRLLLAGETLALLWLVAEKAVEGQ